MLSLALLLIALAAALALLTWHVVPTSAPRALEALPEPEPEPAAEAAIEPVHAPAEAPPDLPAVVRFEAGLGRGTRSAILDEHSAEWRAAMLAIGDQLRAHDVIAVVFAHGSFVGTDPTSGLAAMMPRGHQLAQALHRRTRQVVDQVLGDFGNFGTSYVRLFEQAIGGSIPCTSFVWSSENHHVGRLEGALDLLRVLATHAELGTPRGRILVLGHSHAGQVFALLTRLLSRSIAAEAILDVARARTLDVGAIEIDRSVLDAVSLDFVTLGAPARYAWASVPRMRSLHVVHGGRDPRSPLRHRLAGDDWVRRIGSGASDFPALGAADRRANARLDEAVGPRSAPPGDLVLVDYGSKGLAGLVSTGLGHGVYTRLDGMLFHASLVASRLYAAGKGS